MLLRELIRQIRESQEGVTTVEYAIMLVLVAIAVAVSVPGISSAVTTVFAQATSVMAS